MLLGCLTGPRPAGDGHGRQKVTKGMILSNVPGLWPPPFLRGIFLIREVSVTPVENTREA